MSYHSITNGESILRLPLEAPGDTARRGEGAGRRWREEERSKQSRVSQNFDRNADIYLPVFADILHKIESKGTVLLYLRKISIIFAKASRIFSHL
jgi:hypothetical protein